MSSWKNVRTLSFFFFWTLTLFNFRLYLFLSLCCFVRFLTLIIIIFISFFLLIKAMNLACYILLNNFICHFIKIFLIPIINDIFLFHLLVGYLISIQLVIRSILLFLLYTHLSFITSSIILYILLSLSFFLLFLLLLLLIFLGSYSMRLFLVIFSIRFLQIFRLHQSRIN